MSTLHRPLARRGRTPAPRRRSARRPRRRRPSPKSRATRRTTSAGTPLIVLGALGGERRDRGAHRLDPVDVRPAPTGQALVEDHVQQREQDERVGAGTDEVVLVGDLRGLGAPRVEHHHPAAAGLAARAAGRGSRARSSGCRWRPSGCAPSTRKYSRAVEVGHRQQQLVAEHQVGQQLVRELVDRGRACTCCACGTTAPSPCRGSSSRGCARWGCPGRSPRASRPCSSIVPASRSATRSSASSQEISSQVSAAVASADPPDRTAQPVGVLVDVLERDRLGADVPARQRVVGVAADVGDPALVEGHHQPADRLAQVAHAESPLHERSLAPPGREDAGTRTTRRAPRGLDWEFDPALG